VNDEIDGGTDEETEDTARERDCGRTKDFGPWYDRLGAVCWGAWDELDPRFLNDLQANFRGQLRILIAPEQTPDGWGALPGPCAGAQERGLL